MENKENKLNPEDLKAKMEAREAEMKARIEESKKARIAELQAKIDELKNICKTNNIKNLVLIMVLQNNIPYSYNGALVIGE